MRGDCSGGDNDDAMMIMMIMMVCEYPRSHD